MSQVSFNEFLTFMNNEVPDIVWMRKVVKHGYISNGLERSAKQVHVKMARLLHRSRDSYEELLRVLHISYEGVLYDVIPLMDKDTKYYTVIGTSSFYIEKQIDDDTTLSYQFYIKNPYPHVSIKLIETDQLL